MYHRHPSQLGGGPTLQHPKPVAPPYPLPSSPPPPEGSLASYGATPSSTPAGHSGGPSAASRIASSSVVNEYQRFSSPPVHPQNLPPTGAQEFYSGGSGSDGHFVGGGGGAGSKGTPDAYVPRGAGGPQQPQRTPSGYPGPQGGGPWGNSFAPGMGAAFGVNDATAAMGMQFGQSAMRAGHDYVERNISRYVPVTHLKHSFNVSNSYVLVKLRTVLFPWRHKPWSRQVKRSEVSGQAEGYQPPREDINSPDAYIPVMAFTTYILLSGIVAGSRGHFDPQLLSKSASTALGVVFIEFGLIKLGCYLLNIGGEGAVVDLLAYSGYKFVGIIVSLLTSLLGVRTSINWAVFIYVFCANAFFLLRSLRYVILPDPSGAAGGFGTASTVATVTHSQKTKRIQFLFAIAVSQLLSMWVLSRAPAAPATSKRA